MEIEELFLLVLLLLVVPVYLYFRKIRKLEQFFKNFPTPPTEFFFGNARTFTSTSAFLVAFSKYTKQLGSTFHLKLGPLRHVLITSDYDFIQFILSTTKSFRKSDNLKYLKDWIGNGLVSLEGEQWKIHRKLLTPAFHFKILEKFVDVFEANGEDLIKKLSAIKESKSIDIHQCIVKCTLDIICETAMGLKDDTQNNETSLYFNSVKEMCRIFMVRTMSIFKSNDFFFRFTQDYSIQKKALTYLQNQTDRVINLKRKALKAQKLEENNETDRGGNKKERKVFLDILLESDGQVLSHAELRDEVNTFLFGGHDTTAAGSSFVLYCLANHKDVQDKVFEEQEQVFGGVKNPHVTYANLQEMKYLDCVIKESMRVYSPVPLFGRQTSEDVTYNGMVIPKGIAIIVYSHGLHMNPKFYPDPEKFDPSRFEATSEKQPYAYIPFSAGPRNCIGQKYAMLEMKSLIGKIIRNFELCPASPDHSLQLAAETVLKSLNGVKIGFKIR